MFNKVKNNQVSKIVHLEIGFNLDEILSWAKSDFKEDVLNHEKLDRDNDWLFTEAVAYKIDILPHPNNTDSIFYHRHNNTFCNHLAAHEYFGGNESIRNKYPGLKKEITGVEWTLHKTGVMILWALRTGKHASEKKMLAVIPTDEIYQLQIGNSLLDDEMDKGVKLYDALDDEKIIEVKTSPEESFKVMRSLLGLTGLGIGYRNTLCFVKAWPDNSSGGFSLDYSLDR